MRILLIEDDKEMALTLRDALKSYFVVEVVHTGEEGEYQAHVNEYDVIVIDYMLPKMSGIEVVNKIRATDNAVPILMLTGTENTLNIVTAFETGVDDYVTKPFVFAELLARIRALMRRPKVFSHSTVLHVEDLTFDLNRKRVTRNGIPLSLRKKELYLLEYLMRNVGQVVTREMIMNHVWESENDLFTNMIDVHIKFLRDAVDRKFEKKLIKTVHGLGYKIEA